MTKSPPIRGVNGLDIIRFYLDPNPENYLKSDPYPYPKNYNGYSKTFNYPYPTVYTFKPQQMCYMFLN